MLGDAGSGSIPFLSTHYRVTEALGGPVTLPPNRRSVLLLVDCVLHRAEKGGDEAAPDTSGHAAAPPLTDAFIEHLAACIVSVAKRAAHDEMQRAQRRGQASQADSVRSNKGAEDPRGDLEEGDLNVDNEIECSDDTGSLPIRAQSPLAEDFSVVSPDNPSGSILSARGPGAAPRGKGTSQDKWRHMEVFCAQSIHDVTLSLSEKFWLAMSRTDGYGGQLLGQAVSGGLDSIRTWVTCCVIWGACVGKECENHMIPRRDSRLPPSRVTLRRTIRDFEVLIDEMRSCQQMEVLSVAEEKCALSGSGSMVSQISDSVEFILRAFKVMEIRRMEISRGDVSSLFIKGLVHATKSASFGPGNDTSRKELHIGQLISVHCGHNGFPLAEDLKALTEFVSSINGNADNVTSVSTY